MWKYGIGLKGHALPFTSASCCLCLVLLEDFIPEFYVRLLVVVINNQEIFDSVSETYLGYTLQFIHYSYYSLLHSRHTAGNFSRVRELEGQGLEHVFELGYAEVRTINFSFAFLKSPLSSSSQYLIALLFANALSPLQSSVDSTSFPWISLRSLQPINEI